MGLWQRLPVPAQDVFQSGTGYGKGCPWKCANARDIEYKAEDYPETLKLCDDSFVVCSEKYPLYPQKMELMEHYVEAFKKVFDNLDKLF